MRFQRKRETRTGSRNQRKRRTFSRSPNHLRGRKASRCHSWFDHQRADRNLQIPRKVRRWSSYRVAERPIANGHGEVFNAVRLEGQYQGPIRPAVAEHDHLSRGKEVLADRATFWVVLFWVVLVGGTLVAVRIYGRLFLASACRPRRTVTSIIRRLPDPVGPPIVSRSIALDVQML